MVFHATFTAALGSGNNVVHANDVLLKQRTMHLHSFTICLFLMAMASGYARFSIFAPEGSALLSVAFIGSTFGLVLCLIRIASRQMEHTGRSFIDNRDLRKDDTRSP